MRISVGDLRYYRDSMQSIGQLASEHVREAVQSVGDGAGVTAMREAAIAAITESVGIHGEMAQALAARLFDEVCATEGIDSPTFDLYDDIIDYGMLEGKVRWAAQYLADRDGGERFMDECGALAEMYAWRCNRDSTIRNCERNGLRYARVPTNSNPCEWCVMLASRGFVYSSADNAEAGSHEHCKCVVVPGGPSTTIEGYDPDAYYDMWGGMVDARASERAKRNGTSVEGERAGIMRQYGEAAKRAKARHRR